MSYNLSFQKRYSYENALDQTIVVPLQLCANGRVARLAAKLDTGAEYCLFDRVWAEMLGIDVEAGVQRSFCGLTGRLVAFEHEVTIRTLEMEFTTPVFFTAGLGVARDLLGRNGWLDRFRVAIVHYDREIYLSQYDT